MVLFGNGVTVGCFNPTRHLDLSRMNLVGLAFAGGGDQRAGYDHGAACTEFLNLVGIILKVAVSHDLDRIETASIMYGDK